MSLASTWHTNTQIPPHLTSLSCIPCEMWMLLSLWWLYPTPVCTTTNTLPLPSLRLTCAGSAATLLHLRPDTPPARWRRCLSLHFVSGALVSHRVHLLLLLMKVDVGFGVWVRLKDCDLKFCPQPQNCLLHCLVLGVVGVIVYLYLKKKNENPLAYVNIKGYFNGNFFL